MTRAAFLLCILLAACAPRAESALSPHSGVERHASAVTRLDSGLSASFDARAVMLRRAGAERWVLLTSVIRRDGDTPRVAEAWSFGAALACRPLDRRRRGCDILWTGTCLYEEKGEIRLSRAAFEAAASGEGMTLELSGFRGRYSGHVPASAFAEVLSRADGREARGRVKSR